jgi:membrane carboxypeptidase/penicillin-binding protein PbpC
VMAAMAAMTLAVAFRLSRLESPEPSWLLRDRQGRFLGEVARQEGAEFGYWPLDEVPTRVAAATIAIEDRRFDLHPGVDPLAVARALRDNLRSGRRVSGASTLAMQVARMQRPRRVSTRSCRRSSTRAPQKVSRSPGGRASAAWYASSTFFALIYKELRQRAHRYIAGYEQSDPADAS